MFQKYAFEVIEVVLFVEEDDGEALQSSTIAGGGLILAAIAVPDIVNAFLGVDCEKDIQ